MSQSSDQDPAAFAAEWYGNRVKTLTGSLRDLADRLERVAEPRENASFDGVPRYTNAAQNVLHDLIWGFANLNADSLVSAAGQADALERDDA